MGVEDLKPLILQSVCHKWAVAIVVLQLPDLIYAITPPQQRGFIKGRYIGGVLCAVRALCEK